MKFISILIFIFSSMTYGQSYQVGEFWSKNHIDKSSQRFQILKESIGEVGASATLFYIGEIDNKHWAITNNHICPALGNKNKCQNRWISFYYYRNKTSCF